MVVTTKISPDPSSVGDLLVMEVIAAYPAGYRVNLPIGVDFAPLHLVSIDEGEPESTGQGFRKVFKVTLQHFDVGEAKVPGFPLTYVGADGQVETVKVAPRSFTVESLLANEADPQRRGEDPPVSLEYPNTTAEIIIYSAAVAMLAGFLLALLWRRLASRPREVLGPPPVPPHERALTALSELEGAGLLETGLVQDYYLELTEIAKGYLEGRFGVEALDRTTDEIRRELKRRADAIAPLQPSDVIDFLEGCDLVKFARFDPDVDEARGALAQVRTMVEETKPKDAPPPAAAPATGDAKAEGATSEAASDPAAPASAAESTNMSEGTSSEGAAEAPAAPAPAADEEARS
ncbi:MAG: hypothetical protein H6711_01675 [Myxococcales bacterium]|nr:hypothetical protein [Myxococcales bacterium]